MTMKRLAPVVPACLALVLTLAGCGGSGSGDDPVSTVQYAFEQAMTMNMDGLVEVSCEQMRDEIEASREEIRLMLEMMEGLGINLKDIEYDMSDMQWDLVEESDEKAVVRMHGTMTMYAPGLGEETQEQDEEVILVKEGGRWKVCSQIN